MTLTDRLRGLFCRKGGEMVSYERTGDLHLWRLVLLGQ